MFTRMDAVKEGKFYLDLGFDSFAAYAQKVCADHLSGLTGGAKKDLVRYVASRLPSSVTQTKLAEITGVPQPQVSRSLSGSTAGDGESGHGGARDTSGRKTVADKLATQQEKVTAEVMAGAEMTEAELNKIIANAMRLVIDARAQLATRGLKVVPWSELEPKDAPKPSKTEGTVGGQTESGRESAKTAA